MSSSDNQITELIKVLPNRLQGELRYNYSGRGMYGEVCLAFTYNSEREAICDLFHVLTYDDIGDEREVFNELFKSYQIDSMGFGVILYFPILKTRGAN